MRGRPGSQASNFATSTSIPLCRVRPAMRVGIDPEHPAPGRLELPGRDAGTAADIENVEAGTGGDDTLHQGTGIVRAGPVVTFGVRPERLRYLPVLMRLVHLYVACPPWPSPCSGVYQRSPPHVKLASPFAPLE